MSPTAFQGLPSQFPGFKELLLRVVAVEKPHWAVPPRAVSSRAVPR